MKSSSRRAAYLLLWSALRPSVGPALFLAARGTMWFLTAFRFSSQLSWVEVCRLWGSSSVITVTLYRRERSLFQLGDPVRSRMVYTASPQGIYQSRVRPLRTLAV